MIYYPPSRFAQRCEWGLNPNTLGPRPWPVPGVFGLSLNFRGPWTYIFSRLLDLHFQRVLQSGLTFFLGPCLAFPGKCTARSCAPWVLSSWPYMSIGVGPRTSFRLSLEIPSDMQLQEARTKSKSMMFWT